MLEWSCIASLLIMLGISVFYNIKFARILIKMEDAIEECLDKLDIRYQSISEILTIPLFYDSPQIKKVVDDIRNSRDAILEVANSIASVEEKYIEKENS